MKAKIEGKVMEILTLELENETVYAEAGSMLWMSDNIKMNTNMKGGIGAGIGRMFSGESLFLTEFTSEDKGILVFGNETPGKIMKKDLEKNKSIICQKDAFLCAEKDVKLETEFTKKFGAGLLGGEGFVLQKLTGEGTAFIRFSGELIEMDQFQGEKAQKLLDEMIEHTHYMIDKYYKNNGLYYNVYIYPNGTEDYGTQIDQFLIRTLNEIYA